MAASDIFAKISAHLVEGMMLHDRMADYYDFLGLMGFKRIHEYRFLKDSAEMRGGIGILSTILTCSSPSSL